MRGARAREVERHPVGGIRGLEPAQIARQPARGETRVDLLGEQQVGDGGEPVAVARCRLDRVAARAQRLDVLPDLRARDPLFGGEPGAGAGAAAGATQGSQHARRTGLHARGLPGPAPPRVDLEGHVGGGGGMGDPADRDAADAGLGDLAHVLEADAAAGFEQRAVSDARGDRAQLRDRAVVEQQEVGAGLDGGDRVGFGFDFDLDAQAGGRRGAGGLHGERDSAGERDVVVLEQDAVVEPGAVIQGPSHGGRVLVEGAPARERLAGVDDARAGAFDGSGETPGGAGDAAQAREEVERGSLAGEDARAGPRRRRPAARPLAPALPRGARSRSAGRDRPPRRRRPRSGARRRPAARGPRSALAPARRPPRPGGW